MFCTNCGSKMMNGEQFCTKCGAKLDNGLETKRIRPRVKAMEAKRSYSLGDLGKEGVPGSKTAAAGMAFTLLSIVVGELGVFTAFIGVIVLLGARLKGFKSIWIWIGIAAGVVLGFNAMSIMMYHTELSNALFFSNLFSFISLF